MKKLNRKVLPVGFSPNDFKYFGKPAKQQDDFDDTGLSDMACVSQFGENKAKYYHCGIVESKNKWFVYCEWGRIFSGKSWENGYFNGQDYQFTECSDKEEAQIVYKKQCKSKNTKRLEQKDFSGKIVWVGKNGQDGYIVQSLATRERGLPDAYSIKDNVGIAKKTSKKPSSKKKKSKSSKFQSQVIDLAKDLVGGTRDYVRTASEATGVIPTLDSIKEVRDVWLSVALERIKVVGNDINDQLNDSDLVDISNSVSALVPRPIPRYASAEERAKITLLSTNNILSIQQDLDTYESSLMNEDFNVEEKRSEIDPFEIFNAELEWLDPNSTKWKWLNNAFLTMTNNRHNYLDSKKIIVKNIFLIRKKYDEKLFLEYVNNISNKNKGKQHNIKGRLQPENKHEELSDIKDFIDEANIFLGFHGTRSVNVSSILRNYLRMPKSLNGIKITGAAFGNGIYHACDRNKALGYVSFKNSYWSNGEGSIKNRGSFVFFNDVALGDPYIARSTGGWNSPPENKDSIVVHPEYCRSVQNDEYVVFNQNAIRIKYLFEIDLI